MGTTQASLYQNILCSNMQFDEYSSDVRKVVLINILLIISATILLIFSFYNIFIHQEKILFIIDFSAFLVSLGIFYDLRKNHNVKKASIATTTAIFSLMVAIVFFAKGHDFTLVWTVFFPMFAIFINGSKKGLWITFLFYTIIFYLTYNGIDQWQNGVWNQSSFVRFAVASVGITVIIYFFEISFDKAYEKLAHIREKEKEYIQTLKTYSITDPLTKVYNRRHLAVEFDKAYEKAKKHNSFFAFYIFDIDFFKQYNDTFGHIAGDTALQKVTQTLMQKVFKRDADSIFRLGGEEFCGIIIADELEKIKNSLEFARKTIEDIQIEHPKSSLKVLTASFGVCVIHDFTLKDFDKMYKVADTALYEAKSDGRNCIVGIEKVSTLK